AGGAGTLRRTHPRIGPAAAWLRRPAGRGPHAGGAGASRRRLQDGPVPWARVRGFSSVPDALLRPAAVATAWRSAARPAPVLPRRPYVAAGGTRRGGPARHRAEDRRSVGGDQPGLPYRRLAAHTWPAVQLV